MESTSSFLQLALQRIASLPGEQQNAWKDLAKAIDSGNEKRVEMALNKATDTDAFAAPTGKDQALAVAQVFLLGLRESYSSPKTGQFEIYTSLLPPFTDFIARNARFAELRDAPKILLGMGEQFVVAYFDQQAQTTVYYDNFYEFQLQSVRDFLSSPGFKAWRNHDGIDDHLRASVSRWLVHLGNFARNRREKAFLNLLDTALLLLRVAPELLPSFSGLPIVLPGAKKAFNYLYAEAEDNIAKLMARARKASNADLQPVIGEWIDLYGIGALPEVPAVRDRDLEETPELTVPFVYRALLVEILGDGSVTGEEESVIKNMREFVEIANEKYNRIFEQVLEARRLQKIPKLDRDFSPREFLLKILLKTIEDGVITDAERAIVGGVANALLLNRETLAEVFAEAKKLHEQRPAVSGTVLTQELERLHELVRYTAMEERMRSVLVSDRGMKIYNKAGKFLAGLRQQAREAGSDKAAELLGQWPVVTFFFEPQVYLYPVIMLFIDSPNVHPTRLEFKGGRIDVEFLAEVRSRKGDDVWVTEAIPLRLFNDGMEAEIPLKALLVGDSLQHFIDGCEETKGKYAIMIMHHARMAAILAMQKQGHLDFSGVFAQARNMVAVGKLSDAVTLLGGLRQSEPEMFEVNHTLGLAHERLAATGVDVAANQAAALSWFKAEIDLNPGADKAMRGMARVLLLRGEHDEAVFWLGKACQVAPASIPNLTALVSASFDRDTARKTAVSGVPEYISKALGTAWQLQPNHPRVVALINDLDHRLGIDLVAQFRALPVATLFQ